jgi:hypothetical protein
MIARLAYARLVATAWLQLLRYDLRYRMSGFQGISAALARQDVRGRAAAADAEAIVCDAVLTASCFYWKRVLCLQRSAATAALLRRRGLCARLVIGYRPVPFLSHAWVEIDGRVVNDSAAYQQRLLVLHTV